MSRLIVKQLPKNITEEKLRNLFSQKGIVTDIKLKYTKEGVFRQFAFIGYENEAEAQASIKYFNKSCINTKQIIVEQCADLGSEEKPKAWSKYAPESSAYKKLHGIEDEKKKEFDKEKKSKTKVNKVEEILSEHKDDPLFVEFMQSHAKGNSLWDNDLGLLKNIANETTSKTDENVCEIEETPTTSKSKEKVQHVKKSLVGSSDSGNESETEVKIANREISDMDYMKSLMGDKSVNQDKKIKPKKVNELKKLFTIKIREIPLKTKREDILKFFKPIKPFSIRIPAKTRSFCYVGFEKEHDFKKAMQKDRSFIKGKQVFLNDFTEKNILPSERGNINNIDEDKTRPNAKWVKQEDNIKNEEDISESGQIFFRNLAYSVNEDEMRGLFEKYGPVTEVSVPVDPITRKIKGFGVATFLMPEHAVLAYSKLDGTIFHGRMLHLLPAKSKNTDDTLETEGMTFKEKKQLLLTKTAGSSHNWNSLFLGSNAIAEVLAKTYDTSKEHILDSAHGGTSAAVQLALGETQIVADMKKFLEDNDVCLDVFVEKPKVRSKTVILVKNLPAGTTASELQPLFSKFGPLGRVVLPPCGISALIEFMDPSEARSSFKKLAYSKFKNLPLYLEWAPENTFKSAAEKAIIEKQEEQKVELSIEKIEIVNKPIEEPKIEEPEEDGDGNDEPEPNTTLFLRNLNFSTREGAIEEQFKHLGKIHMIQVATKKDPDNPKQKIALGYGFIQFKKNATTEKALRTMQFTNIEGNSVELKRSDRTLKNNVQTAKKSVKMTPQTGSKILVRNIPFQAKESEIRDIFKAFGEIKSLRLPLKLTPGESTHRGFGFVDFYTNSDAKKAFNALCLSTHVYGRRLVLEWAAPDEGIEELRKRTAKQFNGGAHPSKRSKKSIFDTSKIDAIEVDNAENEEK